MIPWITYLNGQEKAKIRQSYLQYTRDHFLAWCLTQKLSVVSDRRAFSISATGLEHQEGATTNNKDPRIVALYIAIVLIKVAPAPTPVYLWTQTTTVLSSNANFGPKSLSHFGTKIKRSAILQRQRADKCHWCSYQPSLSFTYPPKARGHHSSRQP